MLQTDARRLRPPAQPFAVVADLPFGGGTAVLRRLLDDPRLPLRRAVVVLEWPVGVKRAAVWPSTALAAYRAARHELRVVRRLPRCAFAPAPSVDAGVLCLRHRDVPLVPVADARGYRRFLERCLRRGRATPLRLARSSASRASSASTPNGAARDLDARQLAALFGAVRPRR